MSAFGIGTNTQGINSGRLVGEQKEIACHCWFTSKGKSKPTLIKFENKDGEIETIEDIKLLYAEKKNYAGIKCTEYRCKIPYNGVETEVKIILNKEEDKWIMLM